MKYILDTFLLILCFFSVKGQQEIKGVVLDIGTRIPFQGVVITVHPLDSESILAYGISSADGRFSFSGVFPDTVMILVRAVNIEPEKKKIDTSVSFIELLVKEKMMQLKEVVVKAPKIRQTGDTINYSVAGFMDETDRNIGDVLKKMPGIEVEESGQIFYQGRAISKFYIENMDMLNSRYGIATNNVAARDVSTVQVLENHQPIKALDSTFIPDAAAINLKLREEAKGTWSVVAQLGAGVTPFLWENEAVFMYFGKSRQHLDTYKTNNNGTDLSKELTSFSKGDPFSNKYMFNLQTPTPPGIYRKRYYDNNSHALTLNNLFKIDEDRQFNVNVIYYNDHEKQKSNSVSSYYIADDSVLVISENSKNTGNIDKLEAELRYNVNTADYYLNNLLNVTGEWSKSRNDLAGDASVRERERTPSFELINNFHYIRQGGQKGISAHSLLGFRTSPQELTVSPWLYGGWIDGEDYTALRQEARIDNLRLSGDAKLLSSIVLGSVFIDPIAGVDLAIDHLDSKLYPLGVDGQSLAVQEERMRNDIYRIKYEGKVGVSLRYGKRRSKMELSLPWGYRYYDVRNRVNRERNEHLNYFLFQPHFFFMHKFTPRMDITVEAGAFQEVNNLSTLYDGYLLQNYRVVNSFDSHLSKFRGYSANAKVTYRDVLSMLFADAGLFYSYSKRDVLYALRFEDMFSFSTMLEIPNSSENVTVNAKVTQSFDFMRSMLGGEVRYGVGRFEQYRQNVLAKGKSRWAIMRMTFNFLPIPLLRVSYEGQWRKERTRVSGQGYRSGVRTMNNNAGLDIRISKKIIVEAKYEHYYNNAVSGNKNLSFTDIGVTYRNGNIHYSLECTNIFDTGRYVNAYNDGLNFYRYEYKIRPLAVMLKLRFKLL